MRTNATGQHSTNPEFSPDAINAAAILDGALRAFHEYAAAAERFRLSAGRYERAKASYAAMRQARSDQREARAAAALERAAIRSAIQSFVVRMREDRMSPERALIAVKERMHLAESGGADTAPAPEAALLLTDATSWAIYAYYEAA